jgi:hypothetical protein
MKIHPQVRRSLAAVAVAAIATTALSVAPAEAGTEVRRSGSCSGTADWKLKAKSRDGRIEVEGEVDSNRTGQTWRWRILHNGTLSARGRATTQAPSGSFSVSRRMTDLAGPDRFVFRAVHPATGQVCRGTLTF